MIKKSLNIIVAGTGTGSEKLLTPEVLEIIENSEFIISHSSRLNLIPKSKNVIEYKNYAELEKIFSEITMDFLLLVSGDPGLYSVMPIVKKRFPDSNLKVLPGISSLQVLCAKFNESWHDAKIISGHGRNFNPVKLLNTVERNKLTVFFCDNNNSPDEICKKILNLKNISVMIGENLTLKNENVFLGLPADFINVKFNSNSIMLIKNSEPYKFPVKRLTNKDFSRDENIKITQDSVRSIIIDDLGITNESVFWDIGAGTGSISINIALENPESEIHSIDYKDESEKIILENIMKFHIHNVKVHKARAKDIIKNLPIPTHVFIGGNKGELPEILKYIESLGKKITVLIECVTLETLKTGLEFLKDNSKCENFSVKQILINESLSVSDFTLMRAGNPVMLLKAEVI